MGPRVRGDDDVLPVLVPVLVPARVSRTRSRSNGDGVRVRRGACRGGFVRTTIRLVRRKGVRPLFGDHAPVLE